MHLWVYFWFGSILLTWDRQTFSVKGQMVNLSGFAGHRVSSATTWFCQCILKVANGGVGWGVGSHRLLKTRHSCRLIKFNSHIHTGLFQSCSVHHPAASVYCYGWNSFIALLAIQDSIQLVSTHLWLYLEIKLSKILKKQNKTPEGVGILE